jgi:hypothetical protein
MDVVITCEATSLPFHESFDQGIQMSPSNVDGLFLHQDMQLASVQFVSCKGFLEFFLIALELSLGAGDAPVVDESDKTTICTKIGIVFESIQFDATQLNSTQLNSTQFNSTQFNSPTMATNTKARAGGLRFHRMACLAICTFQRGNRPPWTSSGALLTWFCAMLACCCLVLCRVGLRPGRDFLVDRCMSKRDAKMTIQTGFEF